MLTWDQIFQTMGRAVGCEAKLVHVPVEFIGRCEASVYDGLKGDKMYSAVLDNAKIKSVVPGFSATISFYEGMRRCLAWYGENPGAFGSAAQAEATVERVLGLWEKAMADRSGEARN